MVETGMKVLVADDEQPARQRMIALLERFPDLVVVDQARNGSEVIQKCRDMEVDLVFLDIQMPGLSGLDVADILKEKNIQFIFVSAYGEHALEAFDLQACDYLTKPVRPSRLEQAIERARKSRMILPPERALLKEKLALPIGKKTILIDICDVMYATVFEGTMELWTSEKSFFLSWTLKNLEEAIGNRPGFFRINRQTLINLDYLKAVEYGTGTLTMKNDRKLELSRSSAKSLRELL